MRGENPFPPLYILLLLITLMYAAPGSAQDSTSALTPATVPTFTTNEISLGIGAAYSPEKDIFNVPNDMAAGTNVGITFAYLRNFNERFAVGFNMYGYYKSIDDAQLTVNGSTNSYKLIVSTLNIGAECRYTFSREKTIRPYALALLSYATGNLTNDQLGSLRLGGICGGGGLGADIALGSSWGLAIEGTATFGTAKWDKPPFTNSTSDDFNPAMYMGLLRVTYMWD